MGLVGLHHVSINVDDLDAALAFYVNALGLSVRPDRPDFSFDGAWLDAGGQQVHLIKAMTPENLALFEAEGRGPLTSGFSRQVRSFARARVSTPRICS